MRLRPFWAKQDASMVPSKKESKSRIRYKRKVVERRRIRNKIARESRRINRKMR